MIQPFSMYRLIRFTCYLTASVALYVTGGELNILALKIAGVALGLGALLGFIRTLQRFTSGTEEDD